MADLSRVLKNWTIVREKLDHRPENKTCFRIFYDIGLAMPWASWSLGCLGQPRIQDVPRSSHFNTLPKKIWVTGTIKIQRTHVADKTKNEVKAEDIQRCIEVLSSLVQDSTPLADMTSESKLAFKAAGQLSRPSRSEHKARRKDLVKVYQRSWQKTIARHVLKPAYGGPAKMRCSKLQHLYKLIRQRLQNKKFHLLEICYVCKTEYSKLHFFYDSMRTPCGDLNYRKRFQSAPLDGQVAIITGSRLKIGYHATLMMLRAGAHVIATTRFPVDSAIRFSKKKIMRFGKIVCKFTV